MIGPLYVHFVPVYCPIGLVLCACIHCTSGPHYTVYMLVAKNNTTCTTTCLYISLCTHIMCNKAFLFGITLAQLPYACGLC